MKEFNFTGKLTNTHPLIIVIQDNDISSAMWQLEQIVGKSKISQFDLEKTVDNEDVRRFLRLMDIIQESQTLTLEAQLEHYGTEGLQIIVDEACKLAKEILN